MISNAETEALSSDLATLEAHIEKYFPAPVMPCEGLPDHLNPYSIGRRIVEVMDEHQHLRGDVAQIDWLFRLNPKRKAQRWILGMCYLPRINSDLNDVFQALLAEKVGRNPDFLIVLSWDYWRDATAAQREILCFHELMHCSQEQDIYGTPKFTVDGTPKWAIKGHDIEEFDAVMLRYGAHSPDAQRFIKSYLDHEETEQQARE